MPPSSESDLVLNLNFWMHLNFRFLVSIFLSFLRTDFFTKTASTLFDQNSVHTFWSKQRPPFLRRKASTLFRTYDSWPSGIALKINAEKKCRKNSRAKTKLHFLYAFCNTIISKKRTIEHEKSNFSVLMFSSHYLIYASRSSEIAPIDRSH